MCLFDDTVYNNIGISKKDATEDEVKVASKAANCHEFIEQLPQGYNTVLGENAQCYQVEKGKGFQ